MKLSDIEATELTKVWCVRPKGQLGSMGYHPFAWTAVLVSAKFEFAARIKALPLLAAQAAKRQPK